MAYPTHASLISQTHSETEMLLEMAYPTPASLIPQTHSETEIEMEKENERFPSQTCYGASASSSSAAANSSSSNIPYDVFINHRGEVKKTFASHLYHGLLSRGLKPFLDQQELQEGLPFPSQLASAIRSASVHVAIFSPKYAESRWCLDELILMRDSGSLIIPVFYHVKPSELRWTDENKNGVYARALAELEKKSRYERTTIQNWRDALASVADRSGFELDGQFFNGDEGYMLVKIIERVVKISKKPELYVARYPTGLNDKVTDFETTVSKQLQDTGKVQVVGIVGLGGVGKTTLALELFNRKRSKYSASYFLSDVRENANKSSLHSLQRVLLKGLGVNELDLHINNIYEGIGMFERHLKSARVLLILDDIDHQDQLEALLPVRDVFHKNSLILITSRDRDLLTRSGLEQSCIYKLSGLTGQHSQELFCSYAFCQAYPLHGFEDLEHKFLKICEGLPLSLKVFGALLFGKKNRSDWEAILYQLKVPTDIQNRLKISYDSLSEEEQQIFLDIACFFIGENKSSGITVWDRSGWKGLLGFKNLEGKCLVEVDDENVIHMHDHLRDLGRDIAEDKLPRRLWRPTGNIDDWLHKKTSVITEVRGIRMLHEGHKTIHVGRSSQKLSWYQRRIHQRMGESMMKLCNRLNNTRYRSLGIGVTNLQLVETEGHILKRILSVHSPNLIWLSWRDCPYTYLPSWIPIKNLRVLKVEGRVLETLWQSKSQAPMQLQELEINADSLWRIPKTIGKLNHLERLVIFSSFLPKLPEEVAHLESLRTLVCKAGSMISLPESLGKLRNLHHIDLSRCYQLERLPDSLSRLTNLHHMNLSWCQKLERLPDSLCSLRNLHHMDLSRCYQLERLPDSLGSLTNLHHIDLSECYVLERLPDSLGDLTNLHHMDLSGCYKLERLPNSLCGLTNLHHLDLFGCRRLEKLPDSLGNLMNLYYMDLSGCEKLERLPDSFGSLINLHHVDLSGCEKLERLPESLGNLTNLRHMDLSRCKKLERLPNSLGSSSNLKHLDLSGCSNLTISSDTLGNIRTLEHVDLSRCGKIEEWPSQLAHQRSLKVLKLTGTNFKELPSFKTLVSLKSLYASDCVKLRSMGDLAELTKLNELYVDGCLELERLEGIENCVSLKKLYARRCPKLQWGEGGVRSLRQNGVKVRVTSTH